MYPYEGCRYIGQCTIRGLAERNQEGVTFLRNDPSVRRDLLFMDLLNEIWSESRISSDWSFDKAGYTIHGQLQQDA